jgi:hypothetical protein
MAAELRASGRASVCSRALLALLMGLLFAPAGAAERDICEGKSGPDLIRCIEAASRAPAQQPAPAQTPARSASAAAQPKVKVPAPPVREAAAPAAEDCTVKSGEQLRHCLAAGGRLSPSAAVTSPPPTPASALHAESCDGKSGEDLRSCVQSAARAQTKPAGPAQPQVISCKGYTAADQPLCVHRNVAIAECRNRQKYPDYDVCLRSYMSRAPEPARADCSKLQARSRTHCDSRNQVFQSCTGDKLGYFACLEKRLGADAVLTRR